MRLIAFWTWASNGNWMRLWQSCRNSGAQGSSQPRRRCHPTNQRPRQLLESSVSTCWADGCPLWPLYQEAVEALSRAGLRNPMRVQVAVASKPTGKGVEGQAQGGQVTPSSLSIYYLLCEADGKLGQLVHFLRAHRKEKVIVYFLTCAVVDFYLVRESQPIPFPTRLVSVSPPALTSHLSVLLFSRRHWTVLRPLWVSTFTASTGE
jgi:hypothetical protein